MKLSSYVVAQDYGFAPNPFGGVLTLATCKPDIRKSAAVGNWIMGTGSVKGAGKRRLIYAAQISQVLSIETYGSSSEFAHKIPSFNSDRWSIRGDNIYFKENGIWHQRKNPFHCRNDMVHDLSGKNVVICENFWYFGARAPQIPELFISVIKSGPKHKDNVLNQAVQGFLEWVGSLSCGISGEPSSVSRS